METTTKTTYELMMDQYKNAGETTKSSNKIDLKNYFGTYLPEGVESITKLVRIIADADGNSPFTEIYGHSIQIEGKWRTFICPKHEDDSPCPFCEAKAALYQTGLDSDKKLAGKYYARKMFVCKVIDREKPEEGPKFWRFNHNHNKDGIHDDIMAITENVKADISDVQTGRDLTIRIKKGSNKLSIRIDAGEPSPLSADATQANAWVSDERTWRDVYNVKPYDYLALIVRNETPVWDKENEKFIAKDTEATNEEVSQIASELNVTQAPTEATPLPTETVTQPVVQTEPVVPVAQPVAQPVTQPVTQAEPVVQAPPVIQPVAQAAPVTPTVDDEDDLPF